MPVAVVSNKRWVRSRAVRALAWARITRAVAAEGATVVRFCAMMRNDGAPMKACLLFVDGEPVDRWEKA